MKHFLALLALTTLPVASFADVPNQQVEETLEESNIHVRPESTSGQVATYRDKYGRDWNGLHDSALPWSRMTPAPKPDGASAFPEDQSADKPTGTHAEKPSSTGDDA